MGSGKKNEILLENPSVCFMVNEEFVPRLFKSSLTPEYVDKYCSAMDNMPVAVYCLTPRSITAKENPIDLENMFTKISSMHTTNTHEAR